jgi:ATP-dependent DNA helicase PIF1
VAEGVGHYTQFPPMLAWAVTRHKSEGKTLGKVLADLGPGAFAPGQVYAAVNRCRSFDDLRPARPPRASDVKCGPRVRGFHRRLMLGEWPSEGVEEA